MKNEKIIVFPATVRDVFDLTLEQIPDLRPLLDAMAKMQPANNRHYQAMLHIVANKHNLRTAKPGEQQKLPLPEPEKPRVRPPSSAEIWAGFTREFSAEILKAAQAKKEPWYVPTVIRRITGRGMPEGVAVGIQTSDGEMDIFGIRTSCKTQLLYLTADESGPWVERRATLPTSRNLFWDCKLLPLYGGGPVNQPGKPKDEYEDNQWILMRFKESTQIVLFRTVVHADKLKTDLLSLSRYWMLGQDGQPIGLSVEAYLTECAHYLPRPALDRLASKLHLTNPEKENT